MLEMKDHIWEACESIAQASTKQELHHSTDYFYKLLKRQFKHPMFVSNVSLNVLDAYSALSCIISEPLRTQLYQGAVLDAVKEVLTDKGECRFLYLGTGPAATLALPVLSSGLEGQIQGTFVEGNPQSHKILKRFLSDMNFGDRVESIHCFDLCDSLMSHQIKGKFDVIMTETMSHTLLMEPQARITENYKSKLLEGGRWIPESVDISLNGRLPLFALTKNGIESRSEGFGYDLHSQKVKVRFSLPLYHDRFQLRTEIQVDKSRVLESGKSVITLPWTINADLPKEDSVFELGFTLGGSASRWELEQLSKSRV